MNKEKKYTHKQCKHGCKTGNCGNCELEPKEETCPNGCECSCEGETLCPYHLKQKAVLLEEPKEEWEKQLDDAFPMEVYVLRDVKHKGHGEFEPCDNLCPVIDAPILEELKEFISEKLTQAEERFNEKLEGVYSAPQNHEI